ncbi:trigger factor [Proteiniphilum sp.]|uniref:trigger factor n=1 Tax=Proteiniphilum sp. TaxID=1926877 RepID=UPI002B1F0BA0|nr:trigger factor [Proteiniphilum sp.]MEA4918415.1 trigger factor [Proteiniphilum sp.]
MKSTLNKTNDVNGTIVIELEKADYQEKVDKSLNQYRQRANIPGFRQGKVPKSLIQKLYGKAILVDEINKVVSDEMGNFIRDNKLKVLGEPLPADNLDEEIDLENDEVLKFSFDVALTPEFDLTLDKSVELTSYKIQLEPELFERQMDTYKQNYGTYVSVEEEAKDTDLIKGILVEMEGDKEKEDGQVIENAILMPSYVKDEETRNSFIGAKVGYSVIINPRKAYDNNEAEIASLLQTTKENVADVNSDFRFDINEVTRYKEAEMNQELFDKVLGEGVVTTEEEFRSKVETELVKQFKPDVDHLFIHEVRDLIVKMMEEVTFPDELLKRWLLAADEKRTADEIEKDFPKILEDLKFHVARQKIVEENEIKVEFSDIEALATEVARAQFAQYGMTNLPADVLQNYTKSLLEKEETVRNLFDRATENKIIDWLKENVTVIEKEITSKDFNELMSGHMHQHDEHAEEPTQESEPQHEAPADTTPEQPLDTNQPPSDEVADTEEGTESVEKPAKKRKTSTKK